MRLNCRGLGSDPALGLFESVEPEDFYFAGSHPGEHLVRLPYPFYVGHDCRALPCRVVSDAQSEPGLYVVEPGCRLEPIEAREHKEHADLSGLRRFTQVRLQNVAVVIAGELAIGLEADCPCWHIVDSLDHRVSFLSRPRHA